MAEKSGALAKDVSALHTLFNGWKAEETTAAVDAAFSDLLDKSSAYLSPLLLVFGPGLDNEMNGGY